MALEICPNTNNQTELGTIQNEDINMQSVGALSNEVQTEESFEYVMISAESQEDICPNTNNQMELGTIQNEDINMQSECALSNEVQSEESFEYVMISAESQEDICPNTNNQLELGTIQNEDINMQSEGALSNEVQNEEGFEHVMISEESQEDTHSLYIQNSDTEDDCLNRTAEHEVIVDEGDSLEMNRNGEGIIRYFGYNNEDGRIISNNGKCYYFKREDIVGHYRYYRAPQKAKFVIDASRPNWAKDIVIIGQIYGQRCYYCLMFDHYTEDCMQLDIDSYNFYYPYL
ncbi:uncharacterized protein LOC126895374 [Daktulosphaira vitifoliae]|uniref:uncharacterized protein LOC126895374 n=1 Tax=Daktulosphaira vitifoliae TaxID=58002 RepID=UPI0021AABD2E|nr:uncharacterized protein LOC126895374 [Daktulosphaira vitifoliae]